MIMKIINQSNNCPFCIVDAIEKQRIIYGDALLKVFPTNIPIVPGHVLICPTRHVSKIDDLKDEELLAVRDFIVRLKTVLRKVFGAEGFNFAWNEGVAAGQSVCHLHIHVVPRKGGDTGIYGYDPREFLYRPGERAKTPDQELRKITNLIKNYLD